MILLLISSTLILATGIFSIVHSLLFDFEIKGLLAIILDINNCYYNTSHAL